MFYFLDSSFPRPAGTMLLALGLSKNLESGLTSGLSSISVVGRLLFKLRIKLSKYYIHSEQVVLDTILTFTKTVTSFGNLMVTPCSKV